jgi:hypothetical protein
VPGKGPQGHPRSPRKDPGKKATKKKVVKAKEGAVCVLEKGRKEEIIIKVMGSWGHLRASRGQNMGQTQSQEGPSRPEGHNKV